MALTRLYSWRLTSHARALPAAHVRRSFVTGMADLGIRPDVIELCVNRTNGLRSGVAGIYNKSQLMPERKAALERWAAHIGRLISGEPAKKVVKLRTVQK